MFKTMNFSNFQNYRGQNLNAYTANIGRVQTTAPRPMSLSAPMIGRVHAAKPGCSACGKKVA
jgi:hypothetical protein